MKQTFAALLLWALPFLTLAQTKPFVLGEIQQIRSEILGETRTLNIYLPEGYRPKDTVRYPVIYLLDGSADEDFIHIAGLVQFNNFEWVGRVPKSIVVGIANTDRQRDFTASTRVAADRKIAPTSGGSDKFIRFIETELQPFISRKFRTSSGKTIIGQSLGGLLATEILLKKPTLFDTYIIVSPSLWWDGGSLLEKPLGSNFSKPTKIYLAVGKEGMTPTNPPRVMEVDAHLLAEKIQKAKIPEMALFFDYLPDENHATILHQAVLNAFRKLAEAK